MVVFPTTVSGQNIFPDSSEMQNKSTKEEKEIYNQSRTPKQEGKGNLHTQEKELPRRLSSQFGFLDRLFGDPI